MTNESWNISPDRGNSTGILKQTIWMIFHEKNRNSIVFFCPVLSFHWEIIGETDRFFSPLSCSEVRIVGNIGDRESVGRFFRPLWGFLFSNSTGHYIHSAHREWENRIGNMYSIENEEWIPIRFALRSAFVDLFYVLLNTILSLMQVQNFHMFFLVHLGVISLERWCPHTILDILSSRQELRLDNHSLRQFGRIIVLIVIA